MVSNLDIWLMLILFTGAICVFHFKMRKALSRDFEDLRRDSIIYEEWELMEEVENPSKRGLH
jgi:hypothetical protein